MHANQTNFSFRIFRIEFLLRLNILNHHSAIDVVYFPATALLFDTFNCSELKEVEVALYRLNQRCLWCLAFNTLIFGKSYQYEQFRFDRGKLSAISMLSGKRSTNNNNTMAE